MSVWRRIRSSWKSSRHVHDFDTFVCARKDVAVGFVAFVWRCECGATTAETYDLPDA